MDSLPVEILDNILSYVQDDRDTLRSCRLVSRLWSDVTRPFLRPFLSTVQDMDRFVELYRDSPTNFRYRRVCFNYMGRKAAGAAQRLLHACAESIKDICLGEDLYISPDYFLKLLASLDSTVLPNLRSLSFDCNLWFPCTSPPLSLSSITTLRFPVFTHHNNATNYCFAATLVDAAPNLKRFEAALTSGRHGKAPSWPFRERLRAIPTFLLRLKVTSDVNFSETLNEVLRKLEEWTNIRLTHVVLSSGARALTSEVKGLMERILGHEAANVKGLTLSADDVDLGPGIDLPPLGALEALTVVENGAALLLHPIHQDRFTALHSVTLRSYEEGTPHFRNSVFVSVKVFRLEGAYYKRSEVAPGYFTPWAHVFPNLESFALVDGAQFGSMSERRGDEWINAVRWIELSLVEYLVPHMRMPSLRSVAYQLGYFDGAQRIYPEANGLVNDVFSGLDNLDGVVEGANEAPDEEAYWAQVEALRRPSLTNLHGLHTLDFDYPMDDAFATCVLLRMKPLEVLTIRSKNLSKAVLEKVVTHHKSLCFTSEPIDEDSDSDSMQSS